MEKFGSGLLLIASMLLAACSGGGSGDPLMANDDGAAAQQDVLPDAGDESLPPSEPVVEPPVAAELPRADLREVDMLYPYRQTSSYSAVLKNCALVNSSDNACNLITLPFIGQAGVVTREAIMERLLVTHEWMGVRFEEALRDAPDDLIPLFGSLTSISMGSTVRPSYYWAGTGAIRLDPANFWLNVYEKSTISIDDDPRSDFGRDLRFWALSTLRIDGQRVQNFYPLTDYQERTLADIKLPVYRLLYHELAHANDFMPAAQLVTLNGFMQPLDAIYSVSDAWMAPRLQTQLPLFSGEMQSLAQVRYRGEQATDAQKGHTPSFIGSMMSNDGGLIFYAYLTSQEDVATMFAATMLKKNFDVDSHVAFSSKPVDEDNYECSELLVGWGVYNRLGDPRVLPRAKWVHDQFYGSSEDSDNFFSAQDASSWQMAEGLDWCTNLGNETTAAASSTFSSQNHLSADHDKQNIQLDLKVLHH